MSYTVAKESVPKNVGAAMKGVNDQLTVCDGDTLLGIRVGQCLSYARMNIKKVNEACGRSGERGGVPQARTAARSS